MTARGSHRPLAVESARAGGLRAKRATATEWHGSKHAPEPGRGGLVGPGPCEARVTAAPSRRGRGLTT
jgi:hypothetical protein